jgi:hypothetical protein
MFGRAATGIKLGLDNMRAALALFDDPQKRTRHVVVAGTNGKGSCLGSPLSAIAAASCWSPARCYWSRTPSPCSPGPRDPPIDG